MAEPDLMCELDDMSDFLTSLEREDAPRVVRMRELKRWGRAISRAKAALRERTVPPTTPDTAVARRLAGEARDLLDGLDIRPGSAKGTLRSALDVVFPLCEQLDADRIEVEPAAPRRVDTERAVQSARDAFHELGSLGSERNGLVQVSGRTIDLKIVRKALGTIDAMAWQLDADKPPPVPVDGPGEFDTNAVAMPAPAVGSDAEFYAAHPLPQPSGFVGLDAEQGLGGPGTYGDEGEKIDGAAEAPPADLRLSELGPVLELLDICRDALPTIELLYAMPWASEVAIPLTRLRRAIRYVGDTGRTKPPSA